jgi:hypothetical protein
MAEEKRNGLDVCKITIIQPTRLLRFFGLSLIWDDETEADLGMLPLWWVQAAGKRDGRDVDFLSPIDIDF